MSLLLDTHVALWAITGDTTLGAEFLDRLRHDPDIFLSPVSLWEITIKQSLARQHRHDRQAYTDAKAPICWEIIQRADGCAQRIGWEPGPTNA